MPDTPTAPSTAPAAPPQGAPHPLSPAPAPTPAAAPPANPSNFEPSMAQPTARRRGLVFDLFHCIYQHGPRTACAPFESADHYRGQPVVCPSCGNTNVRPVAEHEEDAARKEIAAAKAAAAPVVTNPTQGGDAQSR